MTFWALYDVEALLDDPEIRKMPPQMKRDFQIVLAGMTPRDMEWQKKALDKILTETGDWKVSAMNDPDIEEWNPPLPDPVGPYRPQSCLRRRL